MPCHASWGRGQQYSHVARCESPFLALVLLELFSYQPINSSIVNLRKRHALQTPRQNQELIHDFMIRTPGSDNLCQSTRSIVLHLRFWRRRQGVHIAHTNRTVKEGVEGKKHSRGGQSVPPPRVLVSVWGLVSTTRVVQGHPSRRHPVPVTTGGSRAAGVDTELIRFNQPSGLH